MNEDARTLANAPMLWFKHDADAMSDVKMRMIRRRYGMAGIGRYWALCEALASATGHSLKVESEDDFAILSEILCFEQKGAFGEAVEIADTKDFIQTLLEIGSIQSDGKGRIFIQRMRENALYFGQQKANGRKGGRPKKNGQLAGQAVKTC